MLCISYSCFRQGGNYVLRKIVAVVLVLLSTMLLPSFLEGLLSPYDSVVAVKCR